jgi:hypothetical protein
MRWWIASEYRKFLENAGRNRVAGDEAPSNVFKVK